MATPMAIKDSIKEIVPISEEIDNILNQCQPILSGKSKGIANSLVLAKGIYLLKEILYNNENIRKTIEYMQDSTVGFMTDRSPSIIAKAKAKNKTIKPYTYNEIADCVLYALLFGYNLFGKEFYVISGNFYASQYGKYRHIMENNEISDFSYANSPPIFKTEMRTDKGKTQAVQYAEVECFAFWEREGRMFYLGKHPNNIKNDPLVFKIKVDSYMGDDGVVGKALSKLFTRVLARLSCNYISSPILEVQEENNLIIEAKGSVQQTESSSDLMLLISGFNHAGITEDEICHYFNIDNLLELDNADGLTALNETISEIEVENMSAEVFINISKERHEMRQKQEETN